MKKLSIIISLLLFALSCQEETISMWDKLTQAQKDEIAHRAELKCVTDNAPVFNRFKNKSNEVFSSSAYNRGREYHHTFKTGENVRREVKAKVWKRDSVSNEIYFHITETVFDVSNNYFLRITQVENDSMIDNIYEDHCKKFFSKSTTGPNGPLSLVTEYAVANAPNTDRFKDTFTYNFSELAYFASYRLARNIRKVKINTNDQVGTPVNLSSTLTSKTENFPSADPRNPSFYNQRFCTLSSDHRVAKSGSFYGYVLSTPIDACPSEPPAEWSL